MTTTKQDFQTMLSTEVEDAWPGAGSVTDYYDATTMVIETVAGIPTPPDYFLYGTIKTILESRTLDALAGDDLTLTQRQDLYDDVVDRLTTQKNRIAAVITAITAARPVA